MSRDDDRRELCRERGVALYEMLVAARENDETWSAMTYKGVRDDGVEMRDCERCGSTLSRPVPGEAA